MGDFRLGLSMLLILAFLAVSSTSWADRKYKTKDYDRDWYDQYDRGAKDEPPGWDKGKKTGWRGRDLPPGQEKKYDKGYNRNYYPYYDGRRYEPRTPPEYIPVPVPIPTR